MKTHPSWAPSVAGIIRILLGLGFLAFGIMKLTGDTTMYMNAINGLQNKGLSFIPTEMLYWLGIIGEITAGVLLLLGIKTRLGAAIGLLVMIFAIIGGGVNGMAVVFLVLAGFVKYAGTGNWGVDKDSIGCGSCCGSKATCSTGASCGCGNKGGSCGCTDGSCDMPKK